MIEIISGEKGKGKTKELLNKVNASVVSASGNIVYLDKSQKHMYELNNKVRLINVSEYPIQNCSEFIGFVCGIASQDYDLEQMYLDSFLKIANLEGQDLEEPLKKLDAISEQFKMNLVISISVEEAELPEFAKSKVIISC